MRWCDLGGSWAACISSRHSNDHARRLQGPRLHDDAPVRRTAQEEPAAVGADAQLSETQSHPVRGSPSQSTSLHHRSQEFVVASLEKVPKTGKKASFFPRNASFWGKNENFCRKNENCCRPTRVVGRDGQMGLPIWRVVVLHSHNPDGPQIWHAFNLD